MTQRQTTEPNLPSNRVNMIGDHCALPSNTNDITLLARRCDELENRNKELQNKNNELQNQLTLERRCFADMASSLKNEMDFLKKTTSELEDQVASLIQNRNETLAPSIDVREGVDQYCASGVTCMSDDDAHQYQSEIDLFRVLCDIWKNKYRDLEGKLHHSEDALQDEIIQGTHPITEQLHRSSSLVSNPIKKLVRSVSLLKNLAKQKSLQTSGIEKNSYLRSSSDGSSSSRDGTDETQTTAEASFSSSFCVSSPMLSLSSPSNNRCLVSCMPWKRPDFHSSGLYSGQIDISSKLPDGFGVFRCSCSNHDCCLKGDWVFGELAHHLDSEPDCNFNCGEDEVNPTVSGRQCSRITQCATERGATARRSSDGDVMNQALRRTLYNRFSSDDLMREFYQSDSISVTEL